MTAIFDHLLIEVVVSLLAFLTSSATACCSHLAPTPTPPPPTPAAPLFPLLRDSTPPRVAQAAFKVLTQVLMLGDTGLQKQVGGWVGVGGGGGGPGRLQGADPGPHAAGHRATEAGGWG